MRTEEKCCMEELQCNIVVMKRSRPKVLRLNLVGYPEKESKSPLPPPTESSASVGKTMSNVKEQQSSIRGSAVTPNSSPESEEPFGGTDVGTSSVSSTEGQVSKGRE